MTRRCGSWLLAGVVVGAAALGPGGTAAAAPATPRNVAVTCVDDSASDFDGDGALDLAIGVPSEDRGKTAGAGAVEIRHPCNNHPTQALVLPVAHAHDGFGSALGFGSLNDDSYLDLAVGVPGLDVAGQRDAGGVAVFYGSAKGLRYAKTLTQNSAHVAGSVQAHARFGQTIAIETYAPDRTATLRVGEPGRTVAGQEGAGGVVDYDLRHGRVLTKTSRQITLDTPGIPGSPHTGDAMGAALYSDYEVGIPNRTVRGAAGAGAVLITTTLGRATLLTQASPGMPGTPEPGDHFGASLAQDWFGAPGESVGSIANAGVVERPSSDPSERVSLTQHDADPSQVVEAGDRFGAALTETGFLVDDTEWRGRQLYIGAPGQDVAGHADVGTVSVVGESYDPDGDPFVLGARFGELGGRDAVTGGHFGAVLARVGLGTVQVGAPDALGGRLSLYGAPEDSQSLPGLVTTYAQRAGKPETGDRYGGAVALGPV
ncbi:hypothetical protein [uncultured Friedmanniella sp.]|uniref:hypothetical protein n=1 Tax=uncultured Friedmanniella sp. TaxID=335381 RepID=UPI0035CB5EBF